MISSQIRIANVDDVSTVAGIVTDALVGTRLIAWLIPDPADRRSVTFAWARSQVEYAIGHGTVYLFDDQTAAAVWLHHDRGTPPVTEYCDELAAICGPHLERFRTLDRVFGLHHPTEPHHHLRFMAGRPDMRYLGRGNALLVHHHSRLDASGTAGYFEVNATIALGRYVRHGYLVGAAFGDPRGMQFWPMWRPAAAQQRRFPVR
jgi:hypothetical protein